MSHIIFIPVYPLLISPATSPIIPAFSTSFPGIPCCTERTTVLKRSSAMTRVLRSSHKTTSISWLGTGGYQTYLDFFLNFGCEIYVQYNIYIYILYWFKYYWFWTSSYIIEPVWQENSMSINNIIHMAHQAYQNAATFCYSSGQRWSINFSAYHLPAKTPTNKKVTLNKPNRCSIINHQFAEKELTLLAATVAHSAAGTAGFYHHPWRRGCWCGTGPTGEVGESTGDVCRVFSWNLKDQRGDKETQDKKGSKFVSTSQHLGFQISFHDALILWVWCCFSENYVILAVLLHSHIMDDSENTVFLTNSVE